MRYPALALAALCLAGCNVFQNDVERGYERAGWFSIPAAFTTADVRMISERRHPVLGIPVVCTEPSPDVAKALSTAVSLSGQGGDGTATGALAFGGASAEAVAELAGRSTALLGLRDGLFRACEAYANGAIGADAYALVLSRYGQLMTTLFLGQDVAGVTTKGAVVQSPPVSVTVNTPGKDAGAPAAKAEVQPGSGNPQQSSTESKPVDNAALALTRMNEDYMNLDYNLSHLLLVSCINDADPTRLHGPQLVEATSHDPRVGPRARNYWLERLCARMTDPRDYTQFRVDAEALAKAKLLAPPVNLAPAPAAAAPAAAKGPGK